MKNKPIWLNIILIVLMVIAGVTLFIHNWYADDMVRTSITEISFSDIELTDTTFKSRVVFSSSGKSYRAYDYTIEGNTLYISVYGGLAGKKYPDGDFVIDIHDNLQNITTVCLKGTGDVTVLYTR